MDRRKFSLSLIGSAVLAMSGCGGADSETAADTSVTPAPSVTPSTTPELASATSLPASTMFLQSVAAADGEDEIAPGQANCWDLRSNFGLSDGSNDQFDGALMLSVVAGEQFFAFPADQTYAELTALGPEMDATDGVKYLSFVTSTGGILGGGLFEYQSAVLHPVRGVMLQQTLNLGAAQGTVSLTWGGQLQLQATEFAGETSRFQVVVRSTTGDLLGTLYAISVSNAEEGPGSDASWGSADLTPYAGQTVVLSFERDAPGTGPMLISNVSVLDSAEAPVQFVTNGDFAAGSDAWVVRTRKVSQNVRSGVRTLAGLDVQRTFYTQPNQLWARYADEFVNPTAEPITVAVQYDTNLGSDGSGIVYPTPETDNRSLTTWDGSSNDRDIGLVHGRMDTVIFSSASLAGEEGGEGDADDDVSYARSITVPAGGRVTVLNFVILSGTDTGQTATDDTARATEVDTLAAAIVNGFRTDLAYQRGLTQAQLDTVVNF